MEIDIDILNKQYLQLSKIINLYEENYLNFFNALNQALTCWQDNISQKYSDLVKIQKKESDKAIEDLKNFEKTLKIVINKYEPIAKHIAYFKENKIKLYNSFEKYIAKIQDTINMINSLDLNFCPTEQTEILKIKNDLINIKKELTTIFNINKKIIKEIEQKESEINKILSKYNYQIVREIDYNNLG